MKAAFQKHLIAAYGRAARSGMLTRPVPRRLYEVAYWTYKATCEAGPVRSLRPFVVPGSLAIDVGANIGFFSTRFARWVQPGGRVLALEPERENASRLRDRLRRHHLCDVVDVVEVAATERDGDVCLVLDPGHPGDHHIGITGQPVAGRSIDSLLAARPARRVSVVKIDVQGAEGLVVDGCRATIASHRPALFVEIHDPSLRRFESSSTALVEQVCDLGYVPHLLQRRGAPRPIAASSVGARFADRYGDVLFLPASARSSSASPRAEPIS